MGQVFILYGKAFCVCTKNYPVWYELSPNYCCCFAFSPFPIHPSKLDCVTYKWLPAIRVPCRSSEILKRLVSMFINASCRSRKLNEILCLCRNFIKGG